LRREELLHGCGRACGSCLRLQCSCCPYLLCSEA
jgi:hypothetical protein